MTGRSSLLKTVATLALAATGLAACASVKPSMPGRMTASAPPSVAGKGGRVPGTMKPYQIKGVWYYPAEQPRYNEVGVGSWYGEQFHNRYTANGEVFDMDAVTAAHTTLPLPSLVEVTNLENGRKITVRVNDRGPFIDGRIIDLSRAAADGLGYRRQGVAKVRVRYLGPAPANPFDGQRVAQAAPAYTPPVHARPADPTPIREPADKRLAALATPPGYRVQAAAFANRDNATRAASLFSQASIEPAMSDGIEIYRVILGPAADEPAAWALRDQAAAQGFADARILRP